MALKELSQAHGLPIIGLKSENGLLKKSKLDINNTDYNNLQREEKTLDMEIDRLFTLGKTSADGEVNEKLKQLTKLRLKLQSAFKRISFSEAPMESLPAGESEAEEQRKKHLLEEIGSY